MVVAFVTKQAVAREIVSHAIEEVRRPEHFFIVRSTLEGPEHFDQQPIGRRQPLVVVAVLLLVRCVVHSLRYAVVPISGWSTKGTEGAIQ